MPASASRSLHVGLAEVGDPLGVEACERGPERLALAQDRDPREARLEGLEADPLVQAALVDDRTPPTPRRGSGRTAGHPRRNSEFPPPGDRSRLPRCRSIRVRTSFRSKREIAMALHVDSSTIRNQQVLAHVLDPVDDTTSDRTSSSQSGATDSTDSAAISAQRSASCGHRRRPGPGAELDQRRRGARPLDLGEPPQRHELQHRSAARLDRSLPRRRAAGRLTLHASGSTSRATS